MLLTEHHCACFLDELFACSLDGLVVNWTVLGDQIDSETILVLVSCDILSSLIQTHGAHLVG